MPQRTLAGRLVDAARQPLAGVDIKVWPAWPTPAGIPDAAADVLMVRRHLHVTTDPTGAFTLAGLETTTGGELDGWCWRAQFVVDGVQADVAFLLPAGAGVAQLSDVMLAEVTPGAAQFVVIAGAAEATAAAVRAEAAAKRAEAAAPSAATDSGWVAFKSGDYRNSFTSFTGSGWGVLSWRKRFGWAAIGGGFNRLANAAWGVDTVIANLPVGARPAVQLRSQGYDVRANGDVVALSAGQYATVCPLIVFPLN